MGLSMGLSSWWQWLRRGHAFPATHMQLVMYTRSGCHLCESAWIELVEAQKRHGFALSAVDVDDDPELGARFGIRAIPTMMLFKGGREVAREAGAMGAPAILQFIQRAP